ncbi:hypothetical protein [uncultured Mediterranean phage uvMED]|nr:hypothetical protein [uncultured Mediterranean phage uvMED]
MKLKLDKYYTPDDLAKYCVNKTKEVIGEKNITQFLEPSAGSGAFIPYLGDNYLAFDIEPEAEGILQMDYLSNIIEYKRGRCVIGNPPYGKGNYTSVKFFKNAISQGDYISFILPISQLNNNMYMYEFDMIHSEDLGKRVYSGRKVHCVLNIYRRSPKGFNKKPNYDLQSVTLKGVARGKTRNDKVPSTYDFSICGFGSVGQVAEHEGQYCQQIYVTIHDDEYRNKITKVICNTDWISLYGMTATPKLKHWMIYKHLRKVIPELN